MIYIISILVCHCASIIMKYDRKKHFSKYKLNVHLDASHYKTNAIKLRKETKKEYRSTA